MKHKKRGRKHKQWTLYKGEEIIDTGSTAEIVGRRGISCDSLLFLKRPSRLKRIEHYEDALILVELDMQECDF